MPTRQESSSLLKEYITNPSLLNHCGMVAKAMEAHARKFNLSEVEIEEWWTAGLLHDLDWERYPDEHPNKACNEILPSKNYSEVVINAIKAHAPDRTNKLPETLVEKYLFACDELSGFLNAASLMRPTKFEGMEVSSIKKKLKDKRFAANVNRDDITHGADLIKTPLEEHIAFMISVFQNQ